MIFLMNDYSEGAHEKILEAVCSTNLQQQIGYSNDEYCHDASKLIKAAINKEEVDVHFLVGGTQTNMVALSAFLKPYQAVIATSLGHIAVHETGAIESTGHKVIEVPGTDAKLTPAAIESVLETHTNEHMVMPKVAYISNATEMGTVYKKAELEALSNYCRANNLYLYMDGARLATALMSDKNDLTLEEIASLCDAFYIGGTKNGAMLGEALIICNDALKEDMRYYIKRNGALLAKGRYIGLQFATLMQDNLYFDIAKHTNKMAKILVDGIKSLGYKLSYEAEANIIFMIAPNEVHAELQKYCHYEIEGRYDDNHTVIRFVTSFATREESIHEFLQLLESLSK